MLEQLFVKEEPKGVRSITSMDFEQEGEFISITAGIEELLVQKFAEETKSSTQTISSHEMIESEGAFFL